MAKKLTEFKNPVRAEKVNLLNPADWISGIGFIAWFGLVLSLGAKLLQKADTVLPGNNTPASYAAAANGVTATTDGGITLV